MQFADPPVTELTREKKGSQDRTLVFDTLVSVGRDDPLWVAWPNATLDRDAEDGLRRLLANLRFLGRAEAWVEADLAPAASGWTPDWNCVPAAQDAADPVPVLCPNPDGCFAGDYDPAPDPGRLVKGKIKPTGRGHPADSRAPGA